MELVLQPRGKNLGRLLGLPTTIQRSCRAPIEPSLTEPELVMLPLHYAEV